MKIIEFYNAMMIFIIGYSSPRISPNLLAHKMRSLTQDGLTREIRRLLAAPDPFFRFFSRLRVSHTFSPVRKDIRANVCFNSPLIYISPTSAKN